MEIKDQAPKDSKAKAMTHLKEKVSRKNKKTVIHEDSAVVVMEVKQKAYRGEELATTIRKDHKSAQRQQLPLNASGRSL